jgi:transposase-like protein
MPDASLAPDPIPPCPRCAATHVVRNGRTQAGSPNFLCRGCGRRFVAHPKRRPVSDEERELVRRLLRERMGVRAIARATGRSRSWVQAFVNALYREQTEWAPGPLKKSPANR